ncbi:hypothetical protein L0V05_02910 [Tabrizicola sp. J26]|uniref:hypothetical protein n=1 Tax=Alitabrizicola rongguiensis TaxID=2909234 RepID=UPI001F1E3B4D|nr:hypothetical protein [Tabrizicola rongguiensis]MCF1707760.1 hypothetical protein [Tabrizicola rongguiensis]
MWRILALWLTLCLALQTPAAAQTFAEDFDRLLKSGRIDAAEQAAADRLDTVPGDAQAQFALGAAQFLGAVEGLGRGLYRLGLIAEPADDSLIAQLPILRLPVPPNSHPQPMTPEALRAILLDFGSELARAEKTLAAVPPGPVELPIEAGEIRLDFAGTGSPATMRTFSTLWAGISGLEPEDLGSIRFDEGDVPWLRGYAHLLEAVTDLVLAHDFDRSVDLTFQDLFPSSSLASAPLREAAQQQRLIVAAIGADCEMPEWYYDRVYGTGSGDFTPEEKERIESAWACQSAMTALWSASVGDLVAFAHLLDWPVVEPARMVSARQHLLDMIALSRQSWALVLAETDDDREWLPSPRQIGPFSNMRVTDQTLAAWNDFLDEAEAVLNGTLLIPHWRFPSDQGLNIRRMFEEPRRFDLVLLLTGSGAIPYIEKGALAPDSTMEGAVRVLDGGPLAYFFWFN